MPANKDAELRALRSAFAMVVDQLARRSLVPRDTVVDQLHARAELCRGCDAELAEALEEVAATLLFETNPPAPDGGSPRLRLVKD